MPLEPYVESQLVNQPLIKLDAKFGPTLTAVINATTQQGSKIKRIQVNGVDIEIVNGVVNIIQPTDLGELDNNLKHYVTMSTIYEFPLVGEKNTFYITEKDGIWIWDETFKRIALGIESVDLINGGSAIDG